MMQTTLPWTRRTCPLRWAGLSLLAAGMLLPESLQAGDKLNIGGAKTREQPVQSEQVKQSLTLDNLQQTDLRKGIPAQPLSRQRARTLTRFEQRLRNDRDERRNWALLAPGQLQDEEGEEYDFGVRDYDLQRRDTEGEQRDYTFHGIDNAGNSTTRQQDRNARRPNGQGQRPESPNRQSLDPEDPQSSRSLRTATASQNGERLGAHMSENLDLKGLLDPTSSDLGANAHLLRNQPGPSQADPFAQPNVGAMHEQRMTSFRQLINAPDSKPGPDESPLAQEPSRFPPSSPSQNLQNNLLTSPRNGQPQSPLYLAPNHTLPTRAFNLPNSSSYLNNTDPRRDLFQNPTSLSPQPGLRDSGPTPNGWTPPKRRF